MGCFELSNPVSKKETVIIEGDKYFIFDIQHSIDNDVTTVYADKI